MPSMSTLAMHAPTMSFLITEATLTAEVREIAAIGSDGTLPRPPVFASAEGDDRGVEQVVGGRAVEVCPAVGEDAAIGRHEPVPTPAR